VEVVGDGGSTGVQALVSEVLAELDDLLLHRFQGTPGAAMGPP
jgi:hypothetical protein